MATSTQAMSITTPSVSSISTSNAIKLTDKQRLFLIAYLEHGNATKAAISAGYSEASAGNAGSRLLTNASIQAAISEEMEKRGITVTYVLENTRRIIEHEKTRNADKLTGLQLIARHLGMLRDNLDVNLTHDLADRVAQARQRVTEHATSRALPASTANQQDTE